MDNQLSCILREIFDDEDMDSSEIIKLIDAIKLAGIKKVQHLKWLRESDIKDILPPVQVRMLLEGLQLKLATGSGTCTESSLSTTPQTSNVSEQSVSFSLVPSPHVSMVAFESKSHVSMRPSVPSTPVSMASGQTWAENFIVPWAKCSNSFLASVDAGKPPSETGIRELISHTMSDVFLHTRHASRESLRRVAKEIVKRNPQAFADYINGLRVADGVNSIMLKLEAKKENLNRRYRLDKDVEVSSTIELNSDAQSAVSVTPKSGPVKRKRCKFMSFGCVDFEPYITDVNSVESMEGQRLVLCAMFETNSKSPDVERLMRVTYPLQRQLINNNAPIGEVISKWPFLGNWRLMLRHFNQLTGVELEASLQSAIARKCQHIYEFFTSGKAFTVNPVLQQLLSETRGAMAICNKSEPLLNSFPLMMMAYFRENLSSMVQFHEQVSNVQELDVMSLPSSPLLIGLGCNVHSCRRFVVVVNRNILPMEISEFLTAVGVLFACYYVFNLEYDQSCVATLEFIQRDILAINPSTGTKCMKGRKRGTTVCSRVVTFCKKFAAYKTSIEGLAREGEVRVLEARTLTVSGGVISPQNNTDTGDIVACERKTLTTRTQNAGEVIQLSPIDGITQLGETTKAVAGHAISNELMNVHAEFPPAPEVTSIGVKSLQNYTDTDDIVACERETVTTRAQNAGEVIQLSPIDGITQLGEITKAAAGHAISNELMNVDAEFPPAPEVTSIGVISPQNYTDTDDIVACERETVTTRAQNAGEVIQLSPIDGITQLGEITKAVARHAISNGLVNVDAEFPPAPEVTAERQNDSVDVTPCLYCEILYYQSDCKWFQCKFCLKWACKKCARMGRKKSFVCHNCK